jgi:Uma2 family endonuclease
VASESILNLTYEQYLELERAGQFRYEFIDDQMIAMACGTVDHAVVSGNLFSEPLRRLAGSGCRPFGSDLRVQVSRRFSTCPDVSDGLRESGAGR